MRHVLAHELLNSAAWPVPAVIPVDDNRMQTRVAQGGFLCVSFPLESPGLTNRFGVRVIDIRTGAVLAVFTLALVAGSFPGEAAVMALALLAARILLQRRAIAPAMIAGALLASPGAWAADAFPGTSISGASGSVTGTNTGAGSDPGEPAASGTLNTIWYSWVAPSTGTVTFETCSATQTNFDTFLQGFSGATLGTLTLLGSNDDACVHTAGALASRISFAVTSGVTYSIQVDGFNGLQGNYLLSWSLMAGGPPANNDFPGTTITGASGTISGTTINATGQAGESTPPGGGALTTVWYNWTATANGTLTVGTCSSTLTDFDTTMAAYTGAAVGALGAAVASNDDACASSTGPTLASQIAFAVTSGTTYRIQIDGYGAATGNFLLTWSFAGPSFSVTKTASTASVSAPGSISYTISVDNTGNVQLTGLTISDALTQGGSPRTLTSGPTYSSGDTDGDGRIDTNEIWIYAATYSVTQSDVDNGGTFSNTATFDTAQTAPSTSAAATTTVTQSPSFTVVKTQNAGANPVTQAGQMLGWSILVDNTGNLTLNGLTISDALTLGGSPRTLFAGPTYASGDTDSDGQIDTAEVWQYSATYQTTQADLDGSGSFSNTATFDTAQTAPAVTSAAAVTAVTRAPTLAVTKTADATALLGNVVAGQTITYTYVVNNTGKVTVNNVSVSDVHNGSDPDPIPGSEALTDVAPLLDSTDATAGDGVWSVLRPGDSVTFTATYVVTQTDVDTLQ